MNFVYNGGLIFKAGAIYISWGM